MSARERIQSILTRSREIQELERQQDERLKLMLSQLNSIKHGLDEVETILSETIEGVEE